MAALVVSIANVAIAFTISFAPGTLFAAGPSDIAKADQSLWPEPIVDRSSYDKASRAELLAFLAQYNNMLNVDPTPESLGIKKIDADSIKAWKSRSSQYWLNAYQSAAVSCSPELLGCGFKAKTFPQLLEFAVDFVAKIPAKYAPWLEMSKSFYAAYLREQARLAGLFPHPTSEVLPLTESELIGDRFNDGEFLISLDDGPTPKAGHTTAYADMLRKNSISAYFFALGDALQARLSKTSIEEMRELYARQCLASHGYEHKSHQNWKDWKSSLEKTRALIVRVQPEASVAFRPPYGQRTAELIAEQTKLSKAPLILWNIDSQDWHSKINPNQVADRVKKLMLLWRKGILLFHDVHNKGLTAIPEIVKLSKTANLRWIDCHAIK